jgi:16S rRNA (guanine527-N7)-methyltransferase
MTITSDAAARQWLTEALNVSRETMERFAAFAALLAEENQRQNLVSAATLDQIWVRHFVDSAQLLSFDPDPASPWLDLGTGAGFPGLIVAALRPGPVTLVESRRLRTEFLERGADVLGVRPRILHSRIERVPAAAYRVISARAFAPALELLDVAHRFSTENTRWILPKGRKAQTELEAAESSWQGSFRLEPSMTDPDSGIIIADGVKARSGKTR